MIHIVCTVGKTVYGNVNHPVKYCLPHTNDHCVWAFSINESPRWWLSTWFPEFPAPEGRLNSAPFSKSPAFTLAVQWRIVAMSARSTGIQAGKEGNRDGNKFHWITNQKLGKLNIHLLHFICKTMSFTFIYQWLLLFSFNFNFYMLFIWWFN